MASLLELLVSRGIITPEQAQEAAALAEETGAFIGRILVSQGAVDEQSLARFLAQECTEAPGPEPLSPDEYTARLLPEKLMRNYAMVPVGRTSTGVLRLAVAEPLSIGGIDQVKRRLGMPVRLVLVSRETIERLLEQVSGPPVVPSAEAPTTTRRPAQPSAAEPPTGRPVRVAPEPPPRPEPPTGPEPRHRVPQPGSWKPSPPTSLSPESQAVFETLRNVVAKRSGLVALVGPEASREQVLRRLMFEVLGEAQTLYLDLVRFSCPEDVSLGQFEAVIVNGVERACEDEEEERRVLKVISGAYAAKRLLVAGMSKAPRECKALSPGMRLSLSLAQVVRLEGEAAGSATDPQVLFSRLRDATVAWSEAAFPGASLKPLLDACAQAFSRGNRVDAVNKAASAVAARLARLRREG